MSYSQEIADIVQQGEELEHVKAFILEVDSMGGMPVAAEEVANAFLRANKPSVAVIRAVGTSAAYWAATGVDRIYASKNSDVGAIGVTISLLNQSEQNEQEGRSFITISSAPYKSLGDPNRGLTKEEERLLQDDVDTIHEQFVESVSINRELDVEKVRALADGSSMLGAEALENGLIDEIGDMYTAEQYLEILLGEEVRYCNASVLE